MGVSVDKGLALVVSCCHIVQEAILVEPLVFGQGLVFD